MRFLAGFGVVVLGLIAAALAGDYVERERHRALLAEAARSQTESLPDPDDLLPASDPGERPVFPFSIVDSGVRSREELKEAMDRDPVVAKHFANFDLSKTRVQTLQAPKVAHVSYRVGDDVFWTRKAVVIPTGETVLTDGRNFCRTRCANQLASTPGPVSPLEPPASLLDTPLPPRPRIVPTGALPPVSGRAGGGSSSSAAGYDGGAGVGVGGGARLSSGRPLSVGGVLPGSLGLSAGQGDAPHKSNADGSPADPPSTPRPSPPSGNPRDPQKNTPNPAPRDNPGPPHGNPGPHPADLPGPSDNPGTPGGPSTPLGEPWTPPPGPWPLPGDPFPPPPGPWPRPGDWFPLPNLPDGMYDPHDPGAPGPNHPPAGPNEPRSIPEPGTTLLMLAGGALAAWRKLRSSE